MKKKKAPLVRRMKEFVKTSVVWGPLDHNLFFTIIYMSNIILMFFNWTLYIERIWKRQV